MTTKRVTYEGKRISIGIDVHKRSYHVTCICDGTVVKKTPMGADPLGLVKFIESYFPGSEVETAYEAGFSGFALHRVLERHGIRNLVVHPASIEVPANNRVKTDKRDSRRIAQHLHERKLKSVRIPTEQEEAWRLLTRGREQAMRTRIQIMARIRMRLHQFGLFALSHDGKTLTPKMVKVVLATEIPAELRTWLRSSLRLWDAANKEIRAYEREILAQAAEDPRELVYRSMPGFGLVTCRILANELGDMLQFPNERALFCFTGLTPSEKSSGDRTVKGHISRQGSARIRFVLVQAAWRAIKKDAGLAANYNRLAARLGKKRAIVAIARKLIGRARALFRTQSRYVSAQPAIAA